MAKFKVELPSEIISEINRLYKNTNKIFGGMTQAAADVVLANVKANVPPSWKSSEIMKCIKKTRAYLTPSDGGINTKVKISGYFYTEPDKKTKKVRKVPAPLVANMFEYGGKSHKKYPKKPFFRKSFKKAQIEDALFQAQVKLSGGLLDE